MRINKNMNIKEELNKLDQNTFNQYDLFNLYSSIKVDKDLKEQVVGLIKESKCEELCKLLSEAYEKQTGIPLTEEAYDNLPEIEDKVKGVTDQVTAKAVKDHEKKQKNIKKGLEAADAEIKDEPFTSGENQPKPDKPIVPDLIKEDLGDNSDRPFEELDAIAMEYYDNRDGESFNSFSDGELAVLWANCAITNANPWGQPYDDEVYEAIYKRPNKQEIFDKAREIALSFNAKDESLKEDIDEEKFHVVIQYKHPEKVLGKNGVKLKDVWSSLDWFNCDSKEETCNELKDIYSDDYYKDCRVVVSGHGWSCDGKEFLSSCADANESLKEDKASAEDAKSMGYEEAKEYCKSKGLNLDRKTYNMILRIAGKKEPGNESLKESETVDTGHYALWDEEPYTKEQLLYELNSDKMLEKSKGSFQVGHPDERDICAEILSDAGYEYEISGDGPWFHFEYWKEEINEDFPYIPGDEDATIILSNIEWDLDGEDKQPDLPKGLEIDFHEVYEDGNDYLFDDEFDKLQKYLEEIYGFAIKDFYIEIKKK